MLHVHFTVPVIFEQSFFIFHSAIQRYFRKSVLQKYVLESERQHKSSNKKYSRKFQHSYCDRMELLIYLSTFRNPPQNLEKLKNPLKTSQRKKLELPTMIYPGIQFSDFSTAKFPDYQYPQSGNFAIVQSGIELPHKSGIATQKKTEK